MEVKEVFVTVVTVPKERTLEIESSAFKRYKETYMEYKEFKTIDEIIQSYYEEAGKSIAFCKIHRISIGYVAEGVVKVNVIAGKEVDIINRFHELLKHEVFKSAKMYGYDNEFLYDVVKFRGRVNGIGQDKEAPQFRDVQNKPWSRKLSVSLIEEVSIRFNGKVSLINALHGTELCPYDKIATPSELSVLYRMEKYEDIDIASAYYIKGLVDLKSFLNTQPLEKEMSFKVDVAEGTEPKDVNVLEHILSSGHLTREVISTIVAFTEENNLDKQNVLLLVKTALASSKENHKLVEEDFIGLKEALGLIVDYSSIQAVVDKNNLGKAQANSLIAEYKGKSLEVRKNIVELTKQFLIEQGKMEQKTAINNFNLLSETLLK